MFVLSTYVRTYAIPTYVRTYAIPNYVHTYAIPNYVLIYVRYYFNAVGRIRTLRCLNYAFTLSLMCP